VLFAAAPAAAAVASDWPAYLNGPRHRSLSDETAIRPSNAASLRRVWHWQPPAATGDQPAAALFASPAVADGRVFIGSNTGVFYARSEATGGRLWSRNLGHVSTLTCTARGITASATVAPDASRAGAGTVYVTGSTNRMYALDAATGTVVWKRQLTPLSTTQNTYYGWSSPTVVAGRIYVGLSSQCDTPLVRGGVVELDQATGRVLHTYWSIRSGGVGASVWTSVAATDDGGSVFATTGNGDEIAGHDQGDSYAIVRLDGSSLARKDIWAVPLAGRTVDADFGGSPTLYQASLSGTATKLVAACNKNGILYAWNAMKLAAGPVWQTRIDQGSESANCLAAPVFDGTALYQPGGPTTIAGAAVNGAVRRLDPATGDVVWETALDAQGLGSASLDASGVLAVPTFDGATATNGVYLLDATSGAILARIDTARAFAQPVFANGRLLVATVSGGLSAYAP
jgi:outer membrane protein assembly factor BamB